MVVSGGWRARGARQPPTLQGFASERHARGHIVGGCRWVWDDICVVQFNKGNQFLCAWEVHAALQSCFLWLM